MWTTKIQHDTASMPTLNRLIFHSVILLACLMLTACLAPSHKQLKAIALRETSHIKLTIAVDESSIQSLGLHEQVSKNLAEWHYPIAKLGNQPFSHTLTAHVGQITHTSTPNGLSFSIGNSDPRSLDFQKADVLPVSCALTATNDAALIDDLSMGFTATETDRRAFAQNKLAEHISTVCFNLLRAVKWPIAPEKASAAQTIQPSWMPEIRIETKTVPANNKVAAKAESRSDNPKNPPDNTVTIEEDSKQEIIIHNQGTPVILHFGYERR